MRNEQFGTGQSSPLTAAAVAFEVGHAAAAVRGKSVRSGGSAGRGGRSLVPALRRRPRLRAGLIQLGYVGVGVLIGLLAPRLTVGPTVYASQVEAVFAGICGGLVALISVVYALLFLVVQFGATTHSPRLNLFRDSPLLWHAFGFFLGSLAYLSTAVLTADRVSRSRFWCRSWGCCRCSRRWRLPGACSSAR